MFEQQQDTGKSASLEEEYAKVQAQFRYKVVHLQASRLTKILLKESDDEDCGT